MAMTCLQIILEASRIRYKCSRTVDKTKPHQPHHTKVDTGCIS